MSDVAIKAPLRIVMITLSGDSAKARRSLAERYPTGQITELGRSSIELGSMADRLRAMRRERADVFAIATESLSWQYGQDALMLFGALAGASESIIIDSRGRARINSRNSLFATGPIRIAQRFARGRSAIRQGKKTLERLEKALSDRVKVDATSGRDQLSITYLRATPAAGTQPGGATSHINGVVNGLLGLGVAVSIISNDDILGLAPDKLPFEVISPDPDIMPRAAFDIYNGMTFAKEASRRIAASPPDLIYQRYSRFSWAGVEASLRSGIPLLLEYNGSEVWIGKHWDRTEQLELLERCEGMNLKAASRVFVISEVERTNLLNAGVPDEKISVNPNGVDADMFRPGIGGDKEREELGITKGKMLVGFVGTFGPWHGVLALADSIALTPKDAGLHFLLIGEGSLRSEVERKLTESGDMHRVSFAGAVSHERVPVLLDACDILVSPHVPLADGSDFFGSPTKLFEYMAMGKGIVASRLGQIGDVLEDNKTALLVEPGNAPELSKAIQKLSNDQELLDRLGRGARTAAIARHTWRHNAERVIDTYRNKS